MCEVKLFASVLNNIQGALALPFNVALYASTPMTHDDQYKDVLNVCVFNVYVLHIHAYIMSDYEIERS